MKPTAGSGRVQYTAIEDKAIIDYVKKHSKKCGQFSIRGNALYKKMEREQVTAHTWQSMKSRYLKLSDDMNSRFEFCQMIKATSKGKDITVLTQPVRSSKLKNGTDLPRSHDKGGNYINSLKLLKEKKKLRKILLKEAMKDFMLKNGLETEKAVDILLSVNGSLEEAEHFQKHGVMTDGNSVWSKEEDDIINERNEERMAELSNKRGMDAVKRRINFLNKKL